MNLNQIKNSFQKNATPVKDKNLKKTVEKYSFYHYLEEDFKRYIKIKKSKVIIISKYSNLFFIIVFQHTIIVIDQSSISILEKYFLNKSNLSICFLDNSKKIFDENITIKYQEQEKNYVSDIDIIKYIENANKNAIYIPILSCILENQIRKSYDKLLLKNRLHDFSINNKQIQIFKEENYIELIRIGSGSFFQVDLIYLIDNEELMLIKKTNVNEEETDNLLKREKENYQKLNHPLIPKFYGTVKNNLVIEYIIGKNLEFKAIELNEKEKIKIIFEIMLIIKYFHDSKMILRDLKPNNIMIDHNKTVVFIDFDRVVNTDYILTNDNITQDLSLLYAAPEIGNKLSLKCDIYSLGKIIYYVMFNKNPNDYNMKKFNDFKEHLKLKKIYENCIKDKPEERQNIDEIIEIFYKEYCSQIQIDNIEKIFPNYDLYISKPNNHIENMFPKNDIDTNSISLSNNNDFLYLGKHYNPTTNKIMNHFILSRKKVDPNEMFGIGLMFLNGQCIQQNINYAINYLTLAANLNHPIASFNLGIIYLDNKYGVQDINKAIAYLTRAADLNWPDAQLGLGMIYLQAKYVHYDINKAIHYFTLAANQNNSNAQNNLGSIYYEGQYISRDINKALYYFTLAANQNNVESQYNLGIIYYDGLYLKRDIQKAIQYFTKAANQNHKIAQYYLGVIYFNDREIPRNITKSIQYFVLSANQHFAQAQYSIGSIYYDGKFVKQDVEKAIYYFTLAANQNQIDAQNNLATILFEGKYVKKDIHKAIHLYTMAADNHSSIAATNLANIYYNGENVQQDINKAIRYYSIAANQGYSDALHSLGKIYLLGNYVPQDVEKSIHYFITAADLNHANAQFTVGCFYYIGHSFSQDLKKSNTEFEKSAKHFNSTEQSLIINCIFNSKINIQRDINKAIHYFTLAANQSHIYAQYILGNIYSDGLYISIDIDKAIHFYKLAADQNFREAQYELGKIYFDGHYIPKNIDNAIYYLTLAANQNQIKSQNELGVIFSNELHSSYDINKTIDYLMLAANNNCVEAQYNLGVIYYYNKYVERDIKKALHFFTLAADHNYVNAQSTLGMIYYSGKFIPRNIEKSIHYYKLASSQNDMISQYNLGLIYSNGLYIPKDIPKAYYYFELAAKKNFAKAQYQLGLILYNGEKIQKDISKSIHYFTLAAEQNLPDAQYSLGLIYYNGDHVQKNVNKAIHYLTLASNQKFVKAQVFLGNFYFFSKNKNIDFKKAMYYYSQAANQNDNEALLHLAELEYLTFNIKKSVYHMKLSADYGNVQANFIYGYMIHEGMNVKQNIKKAIKYYKDASNFYHECAKNNLGILYKNGFGEDVQKNIGLAIEYFKEGINQKNDKICMYNLSHIYIYDEPIEGCLDESIQLLIQSSKQDFNPAKALLSLAIVKLYGFNIDLIKRKIIDIPNLSDDLTNLIIQIIEYYNLTNESIFNSLYESYKENDFLYNLFYICIPTKIIKKIYTNDKLLKNDKSNLTKEFYDGFGTDLL